MPSATRLHTRSGHTSARPLFVSLRIHGRKQEVTEPLFFLTARAAKEVKRGGSAVGLLGGTFVRACLFTSRLLCPTALRYPRLAVQPVCQLDADGILWVPRPLPSQDWREEEDLRQAKTRISKLVGWWSCMQDFALGNDLNGMEHVNIWLSFVLINLI